MPKRKITVRELSNNNEQAQVIDLAEAKELKRLMAELKAGDKELAKHDEELAEHTDVGELGVLRGMK